MKEEYERSVRLRGEGQVTIPAEILQMLDLKQNDNMKVVIEDGRIVMIPMIEIGKDQAWYWEKAWQQGEKEAEADIRAERTSSPVSADEAIAWLHNDSAPDGTE